MKKKIAVIATGGTIAGVGKVGDAAEYRAGEVPVAEIVNSIPQIKDIADIEMYQLSQIDSNDITFRHYQQIKELCEKLEKDDSIDGIVITHGTDTLEETSFLLNLSLNVTKPVIITGAMRPATATSADGPLNLYQAVALAACQEAENMGVLAVFSNTIYSGRDITKENALKTDAFESNDFGMLGFMRDEKVYLMHMPYRAHTAYSELNKVTLNKMPSVEIFYVHQQADPKLLKYMLSHYSGVILAGTGAGNYPKEIKQVIEEHENGAVIVRSSRLPQGMVYPSLEFDPHNKTIPAYRLSPHKARLLLMLALKKYGNNPSKIIECFEKY